MYYMNEIQKSETLLTMAKKYVTRSAEAMDFCVIWYSIRFQSFNGKI